MKHSNTDLSLLWTMESSQAKQYLLDAMKEIFMVFIDQHNIFPKYHILEADLGVITSNQRPTGRVVLIEYCGSYTEYMIANSPSDLNEIMDLFTDNVVLQTQYNTCTKSIIYNPDDHIVQTFSLILHNSNHKVLDKIYIFSHPNHQF